MNNVTNQPTFNWQRLIYWLLITGIFIHTLITLVLASVPPVSRDALNHHLAIPKMYLTYGGIHEIPSMHFSYFPMNLDLLYLIPLWLGFDIGAKYIHFAFALLTAALIFRYLKKHLGSCYAACGALLFLTTPIILKLSVTAYVDLGLIFFSWATLYFLLQWIDTRFSRKYLVLAGIACGLGLGTKYNGLILLLLIATMVPLLYSRIQNRQLSPKDHRGRNINSAVGLKFGCVFIFTALLFFFSLDAPQLGVEKQPCLSTL